MFIRRRFAATIPIATAVLATACMLVLSQPVFADTAESTYKAKCAMCHGPDGKGQTPTGKAMKVTDLASDEVQKKSDGDLSTTISAGKGKMPAYKMLTPDQVKDLVTYIRSLAKK
jgi:mono/diheme cytochrome c family protein